jgi:hypothetical protein
MWPDGCPVINILTIGESETGFPEVLLRAWGQDGEECPDQMVNEP